MGQREAFDPFLLIETAVLEALAGKRAFPVWFEPNADLSPPDLRDFCRRICELDPRIQVAFVSGGGLLPDRIEVYTLEWDPDPPPGLEAHPMRLNGRRVIW